MPFSSSGVMFGVYIVPNGVAIGRPPANCLPPRTVWHAIQSPARARDSPFLTSAAWAGGGGPAAAAVLGGSAPAHHGGTRGGAAPADDDRKGDKGSGVYVKS